MFLAILNRSFIVFRGEGHADLLGVGFPRCTLSGHFIHFLSGANSIPDGLSGSKWQDKLNARKALGRNGLQEILSEKKAD